MTQLAMMTRQQDELILRIDDDISRTELHINNAYSQLLQYIPKINSSRWLYLKIFAILLVFIFAFVIFFV